MKTLITLCFLVALATSAYSDPGTAFTYQGLIQDNGVPVDGTVSLEFSLYDGLTAGSLVAGPIQKIDTTADNGRVAETLDFGAVFDGTPLYLEVEVDADGGSDGFSTLSPRIQILPAPYSMYAEKAGTKVPAFF